MGLILLVLVYLATTAALALVVSWLGVRPSRRAVALLTLLPVAYTAGGFLPGRVPAPLDTLTLLAPWVEPELAAAVEEGSSPRNVWLVDPLAQMLPWREAASQDWLFNPAQSGGAALLANGQSAVLFPTEMVSRMLPGPRAATYSQAARLLIAAFGLFLVVRRFGLGEPAALAGAAVVVGSGYLQLWRLHPHSLTAAMLPWILGAALALAHRPRGRAAVALAVTGALGFLAGHVETLVHGMLFIALLAGAVAVRDLGRDRRRRRAAAARDGLVRWEPRWPAERRLLAWTAVAAGLSLLLAAPVLVPFVENLLASWEWQRRGAVALPVEASWAVAVEQLAGAVTPWAWGDPRAMAPEGGTVGPNNAAELAGGSLGMAAWVLIALGVTAPRRRDGREGVPFPRWCLALGLLGLLVGAQIPGLPRLFAALPLMGHSILARLSLWAVLAGSLLAAAGVGRLLDPEPPQPQPGRRSPWCSPGVGAGVALGVLLVVAVALPGSRAWPGVPVEAVGVLVVAGGVFLAFQRPLHHLGAKWGGGWKSGGWRALAVALALALVVPRLVAFQGWIPTSSALAFYPDTLAVRHVVEEKEQLRAAARDGDFDPGFRVAGLDAAYLPASAVFHGLEDARGYDPMAFAPYEEVLELIGRRPPQGGVQLFEPDHPGLDWLGVRWIFDHPSMGERPGVEITWAGDDAVVYENPGARPRLWIPREVETVPDAAGSLVALERLWGDSGAPPAGERVILEGEGLPPPGVHPNGAARLLSARVEPGRLEAVVEAEAVAVVATSQPALPGWRLTRDGVEYPPMRLHHAFLGAAVEAGVSHLVWEYRPRTWRWGQGLFVLGLLTAGVLVYRDGRHPRAHRHNG